MLTAVYVKDFAWEKSDKGFTAKWGPLGEGSVQSQRVSSSVSAQLGEWVELGDAAQSTSRGSSGIVSSRDARASDSRRVWVRVEELRP